MTIPRSHKARHVDEYLEDQELDRMLFLCNVHLEIASGKNQRPTRAFCDGIINLRRQVASVKRKAVTAKCLGRSSEEGEAEFGLKSSEVYEMFPCELRKPQKKV
ncbi:hypothetical protein TNCV_814771 [Trichonephila clavipes]|nr:hypothetical protein TNCV_814771 [Trichonephila clavipes]